MRTRCPRALLPAVVVSILLAGCGDAPPAARAPTGPATPVEVRTAPVERVGFERSVAAAGELLPHERARLATKVPGRVAELLVDRGDEVREGDVLARLEEREFAVRVRAAEAAVGTARAVLGLPEADGGDELDPEATSAVRLARAQLERARLALERSRQLASEGFDSKSVLDTAEADFRTAEARLQEAFELVAARRATLAQRRAELDIARTQLAETRILAPFDGRIEARRTATGAYLAVGDDLFEVVRTSPLRLVLEVSERDAGPVRVGQLVRARVTGVEEELSGPIRRLSPALALDSRALLAEVELANPEGRLRAGAFAEGRIVVDPAEEALGVPPEAVTSFAGLSKALVVEDGVARERRLELGRRTTERVEVRAGLAEGERVVLAPGKLAPGSPVKVVD